MKDAVSTQDRLPSFTCSTGGDRWQCDVDAPGRDAEKANWTQTLQLQLPADASPRSVGLSNGGAHLQDGGMNDTDPPQGCSKKRNL